MCNGCQRAIRQMKGIIEMIDFISKLAQLMKGTKTNQKNLFITLKWKMFKHQKKERSKLQSN